MKPTSASPAALAGPKLIATLGLLGVLALPLAASAQTSAHHPGRWSQGSNWTYTPIHLNLLRGSGSYDAQILWWQAHRPPHDQSPGFRGGLWGWRPVDTLNTNAYPTAAFTSITNLMVGVPDSNIFCAGHVQLPDRLLVLGGTALGSPENGGKFNRTFEPVTRTWASIPDMRERRWYGSGSILATGDAVVSSGSQYGHMYVFGGKKQAGGYPIDEMYRYGFAGEGKWDPPVEDITPQPTPADTVEPSPRDGHTFTRLPSFLFGGLSSSGSYLQDLWVLERTPNFQGADYLYEWLELESDGSQPPPPRTDHSAITLADGSMVVFGGRRVLPGGSEVVFDDVWRAVRDDDKRKWRAVVISGSSPSSRFGHGMATIEVGDSTLHLVFGGVGGTGLAPTDSSIWRLRFTDATFQNARWEQITPGGTPPDPRWDHSLVTDEALNGDGPPNLVILGGRGSFGGGATLSGELWRLWVNSPTSMTWERHNTIAGDVPAARGGHAVVMDQATRQMLVLGGETASGSGTDSVYVARIGGPSTTPQWRRAAPHSEKLRNHAVMMRDGVYARVSEIYDRVANTWAALDSAPLLQHWYPFMHLTPDTSYGARGRLFNSGPSQDTYWLDPRTSSPGPSWTKLPGGANDLGGGAAVMYLPGKVMKAGSGLADNFDTTATGATRYIDLIATSPQWQSSGDMLGRLNHNLVILPSGQVLAVGGSATSSNRPPGVLRPEIWDPGTKTWYGASGAIPLAEDSYQRDYHSSCIVLPDARVLSSGGNTNASTKTIANIYSPPYLFTAGGDFATRPIISSAVQRIRYGQKFIIQSPLGTDASKPCLIRPGAATHGFDQNQRFVPLEVDTLLASGSQLIVKAPPDSFTAPPGDYLLFVLDSLGKVPAIARWVRVGSVWKEGANGDTIRPKPTGISTELVSGDNILVTWIAPGDDSLTGHAWQYDLRHSASAINSGNVGSATVLATQPPAMAGTITSVAVTLSSGQGCVGQYFAMRTLDESENYSAWKFSGPVTPIGCGGGGCGTCEARAVQVREEGESAESGGPRGGIRRNEAARVPNGRLLVAEFSGGANSPIWKISQASREGFPGVAANDTSGVLIQSYECAAGWWTRVRVPTMTGGVGVRPLVEPGRVVFLGDVALDQVQARPPGFELVSASNSRSGARAIQDADSAGFAPEMQPDDTLTLTFDPSQAAAADGAEDCLFIVGSSSRTEPASIRTVRSSPAGPSFALHANRPNPFERTTTLRFALPHTAHVRLDIFDMQGRRVRVLANKAFAAGEHDLVWDRRTSSGGLARPGIYFYRIEAGEYRARRRMVVLP